MSPKFSLKKSLSLIENELNLCELLLNSDDSKTSFRVVFCLWCCDYIKIVISFNFNFTLTLILLSFLHTLSSVECLLLL